MGTVVLVMVIFALLYVLAKTVATKAWRRFHDRRDQEEVIVIKAGREEGPRPPRPQLRREAPAPAPEEPAPGPVQDAPDAEGDPDLPGGPERPVS